MEISEDFLDSMSERSGKDTTLRRRKRNTPDSMGKQTPDIPGIPGTSFKKGDIIGRKYEVYGLLRSGSFGVVYLVYSHETQSPYALKTLRRECIRDAEMSEGFHREAGIWVDLERHPYLVWAHFVDKVDGQLYIALEYIVPDEEGLSSLDGYLRERPLDLAQSLRWAIQFCHGIEYAYSRGVLCHLDIKPANIMISRDGTLKISDFSLAKVLDESSARAGVGTGLHQDKIMSPYETAFGPTICGTPAYMPPEQFEGAKKCDERSDIYALGIVLYQMAAGGNLPFNASWSSDYPSGYIEAMHRLHKEAQIPELSSPLFRIIRCCLEKEPRKRYQTFKELRSDLEAFLRRQTGEVINPPEIRELEPWEWNNKGFSLHNLDRFNAAIRCYDKALELNSSFTKAWHNKGAALHHLGRFDQAICCYRKAFETEPGNAVAWYNKGQAEESTGRWKEALRSYKKFIELAPPQYAQQIDLTRQRIRELKEA